MTYTITAWTDAIAEKIGTRENGCGIYEARPETATKIWRVDVASERIETRASAERIASAFPKSAKMRVVEISGLRELYYRVESGIAFSANDANKGANETGLKRLRRIIATVETKYDASTSMSSATDRQFENFVATGDIRDDGERFCSDCNDSFNVAAGCECGRKE